jgi:hypothetical protein
LQLARPTEFYGRHKCLWLNQTDERLKRRNIELGAESFGKSARTLLLAAGSVTSPGRGRTIWATTRRFDGCLCLSHPAAKTSVQHEHHRQQCENPLLHTNTLILCAIVSNRRAEGCEWCCSPVEHLLEARAFTITKIIEFARFADRRADPRLSRAPFAGRVSHLFPANPRRTSIVQSRNPAGRRDVLRRSL